MTRFPDTAHTHTQTVTILSEVLIKLKIRMIADTSYTTPVVVTVVITAVAAI
jgi:hypothetical protein